MNFSSDINLQGEVLIPFKYEESISDNNSQRNLFASISKTNYFDYRCVLFQGELLKLYIILKIDSENESFCKKTFENMYFKIEFQSMGFSASPPEPGTEEEKENIGIGTNNSLKNLNEEEYQLTLSDLFTINSDKINNQNEDYEKNPYKEYVPGSKTMVYEIFKQIIVPKNLLDSMLIMKVQLMQKNEISYTKQINALDFYQSGYYETVSKFRIIRTLFKEVKIIRPLIVNEKKQLDLSTDVSLIQAKIENTTGLTKFEDNSLKFSKYLSKENLEKSSELASQGMTMHINDIQILKDETTIDEKLTTDIKKIKELYFTNDGISLSNINFSIYNNELPIPLRPGEEYNLTLKILKTAFLSEKHDENSQSITNLNVQQNLSMYENTQKWGDTVSENSLSFAEAQMMKSRTYNTTLTNKETSDENNKSIKEDIEENESSNKDINKEGSSKDSKENVNIFGLGIGFIKNIFMPQQTIEETKSIKEEEKDFDVYDSFKIYFMTPIILNISSNMFCENLFICIQVKWNNEINRFLKIECIIPKDIYLHEYFEIILKCRNISSNEMKLAIEVPDLFENFKLSEGLAQAKNVDLFPNVISQTKFQNLGVFGCNENKVLTLKYLALKSGFSKLPNFILIDTFTGTKFYISHSSKILVKDSR